MLYIIKLFATFSWLIERFSHDWRITNTKTIISPTNYNKSKQRDEPIRISRNWMYLAQSAGKIARTRCNWFSFSLIEKLARNFLANHQSVANVIAQFISTVIWNCFITIIIKPWRLKIGRVVPFKSICEARRLLETNKIWPITSAKIPQFRKASSPVSDEPNILSLLLKGSES